LQHFVNTETRGRFTGARLGFFERGYVRFSNVYKQIEIEYAKQAVERICRKIRPGDKLWKRNITSLSTLGKHRNPGLRKEGLRGIPFLIGALPVFSEVLKAFILHKPLWDIAKYILDSDDVVYHFSNVTRKPAHVGPNIIWHRDYPNRYICPYESKNFFRVLIPLEDMSRENGCTEVIPKSHQLSDQEAILKEQYRDFDESRAIPLEIEAGDVAIIHPKLLHGGRENRSALERNLVVIQFGRKKDTFLYWHEELFTGLTREEILVSEGIWASKGLEK